MDRRVRIISFVTIVAMLLSFSLTFSVQAQSDDPAAAKDPGSSVMSKVVSKKAQAAALAAWTRKAIAAAKPVEMPAVATGSAEVDASVPADLEVAGTASFSSAGTAAPGADAVAKKAYAQDWAIASKAATATETMAAEEQAGASQTYDYMYANLYSALWNVYPHKWVGRLSFSTTTGTGYCSATAISGNIILTAAHCVFDTSANRWYSGWVFAPAYRNGATPFGTFAATNCWILTKWANLSGSFTINGWTKYDVAVCNMGSNSAGQSLNSAVGYMGRQMNYGYTRHFFNMGYPWQNFNLTSLTYAGAYLRMCTAESFQQTTDTRGMGCYFGPGISGGPWMTKYAIAAGQGYADGVNSGLYVGTANLYGIRFTSSNIGLLCASNAADC